MLYLRSFAVGLLLAGYFVFTFMPYGHAMADVAHFVSFILVCMGAGIFVGSTAYWLLEKFAVGSFMALAGGLYLIANGIDKAGHALYARFIVKKSA